jgi:uncharacterized protein (TIGR02453 family)
MKEALDFLKKLKKNNSREWFEAHRDAYERGKAGFEQLVAGIIKEILKFDKDIEKDTTAASSVFRIYRDVRFSKDKTPYKTHFGASVNPGGRKSPEAGYYIHAEPGNCFVAGGVWMPEAGHLAAIRQEIDYHPDPLLKILKDARFRNYYPALDEDGKLQTTPKGYAKDHPNIELLRHRNFIVSHVFPEKVFTGAGAAREISEALRAMHPFLKYLRQATH